MSRHRVRQRVRPVWIVLAMTAVLLALLVVVRGQVDQWLAARWTGSLSTASDQEAVRLLRQLSALGETGLPGLTEGLTANRPIVAKTAAELLRDELADWELLPTEAAATRLAVLAEALADRAGRFPSESQLTAATFTRRILDWPGGYSGAAPGRIAAACARFQVALEQAEQQYADRFEGDGVVANRPRGSARSAHGSHGKSDARAALAIHEESPSEDDMATRKYPVKQAVESVNGTPQRPSHAAAIGSTADAMDEDEAAQAGPHRGHGNSANALVVDTSDARPLTPDNAGDREPSHDQPRSWDRVAVDNSTFGTVELLRLMDGDDDASARRAEEELARRGFSGMYLELARRLTDPDPAVRRKWAETLPGMRDVNIKPWLLWLAQDEDADVRLAVVTLMATTGDPELMRAVERIARDDVDPRIQRVASQVVDQRQGRKLR